MRGDEWFMQEAVREAQKAFQEGEVPIGAVMVYQNRIIGRGYNRVEALRDPTAHAEMIAITAASSYLKNWRLEETSLYVTLEPCLMCTGALLSTRVSEVIFALEDTQLGGCIFLLQKMDGFPIHPKPRLRKGPLGEEAKDLLQSFFQELRKENGKKH